MACYDAEHNSMKGATNLTESYRSWCWGKPDQLLSSQSLRRVPVLLEMLPMGLATLTRIAAVCNLGHIPSRW